MRRFMTHFFKNFLIYNFFAIIAFSINVVIADITMNNFTAGTTISAAKVNQNFDRIAAELNARAPLNIPLLLAPTPVATHTLTAPSGATKVSIEVIGAGGGGGGKWYDGTSAGGNGGAGGAGGYAKGLYPVSGGDQITVVVGAGGAPDTNVPTSCPSPTPTTYAMDGQDTVVTNNTTSTLLIKAYGGKGGAMPHSDAYCGTGMFGNSGKGALGYLNQSIPMPTSSATSAPEYMNPGVGGIGATYPNSNVTPATAGSLPTAGRNGMAIVTFH